MLQLPGRIFLASMFLSPLCLRADTTSGDVYYTEYNVHTVNKIHYDFNGTTLTLGAPTMIKQLNGADGVIFDTAGNLLVGGQGPSIYRVNPSNGNTDTSTTPGSSNFHLGLDPSGTTVLGGGIPGVLNEVTLPAFGAGTTHTIHLATGAEIGVDTIAFDPTHANQPYFTSSFANGNGLFGTINLSTFVATSIPDPAEPGAKISAHGLAWDSYTKLFVLMGNSEISTYDPATGLFKSRSFPGFSFDQGTVDGKGHLFVAGSGQLTFIDYAGTSDPTSASDFVSSTFVASDIDDVAPLSGLGSIPTPEITGLGTAAFGLLLPLVGNAVRRRLSLRATA